MTQIILEKLKPFVIDRLKSLAAKNNRSLEEEITEILEQALETEVEIKPKYEGWQPGFFEEIIGGWSGETLVREPQSEHQERESFVEEKRQWSPDFFEKTCGSWEGDLVRETQPKI
ncbi:MAG: hypothetical protein F6K39_13815 [Okeania sp. SIO3B3]|nr:hypothetical protein [Okeania sp. SIO3B3]